MMFEAIEESTELWAEARSRSSVRPFQASLGGSSIVRRPIPPEFVKTIGENW
jgi:hypothetical protein